MGKTVDYQPAMSEFNMLKTELTSGENEEVAKIDGPSILFVTEGSGKLGAEGEEYELSEGFIYFVGQGIDTSYKSDVRLVVYRAYAE